MILIDDHRTQEFSPRTVPKQGTKRPSCCTPHVRNARTWQLPCTLQKLCSDHLWLPVVTKPWASVDCALRRWSSPLCLGSSSLTSLCLGFCSMKLELLCRSTGLGSHEVIERSLGRALLIPNLGAADRAYWFLYLRQWHTAVRQQTEWKDVVTFLTVENNTHLIGALQFSLSFNFPPLPWFNHGLTIRTINGKNPIVDHDSWWLMVNAEGFKVITMINLSNQQLSIQLTKMNQPAHQPTNMSQREPTWTSD